MRNRLGVRDLVRARSLLAELPLAKHSLETLGWLLPVLGDGPERKAILAHLGNQVRETAGAAHFSTAYSDGAHLLLHSDRRADGVLLEALIDADPKSDLIPKLVRGLLAQRKAGRWNNTQENAFILLALDRYFAVFEAATPDFIVKAVDRRDARRGHVSGARPPEDTDRPLGGQEQSDVGLVSLQGISAAARSGASAA